MTRPPAAQPPAEPTWPGLRPLARLAGSREGGTGRPRDAGTQRHCLHPSAARTGEPGDRRVSRGGDHLGRPEHLCSTPLAAPAPSDLRLAPPSRWGCKPGIWSLAALSHSPRDTLQRTWLDTRSQRLLGSPGGRGSDSWIARKTICLDRLQE